MRDVRWDRLPALGVVALLVACGGGGGGGGMGPCTPGPATQLVKTSGDPPAWYFDNPLPSALNVTARDANNCAVPGVVVNWAVASGGGVVNPSQSTTGTTGVANTADSLGSTSPQTVTATFTGLATPVTFNVTASAPPTSAAVDVKDNFFSPQTVVIQEGGTVTWTFAGVAAHTVTFTGGPDSGTPQASGTFGPVTFTPAGTKNYFCKVHGGMTGTVRVVH